MENKNSIAKTIFQIAGAIIGLTALGTQLYLIIKNTPASGESYFSEIVRYFSYMTIWTNILVTLYFILPFFAPHSKLNSFFSKPIMEAGIALYIAVVGITYHTMLAHLWKPEGLQFVADNLLHTVVPIYYILYWIFFAVKGMQKWRNSFRWLIFPMIYIVYIFIRGSFTHQYPYPFIDVTLLSWKQIGLNFLLFMAGYLVLGWLIILLDNSLSKLFARERTTL